MATTLTIQPNSAAVVDTYIANGTNATVNFGAQQVLVSGSLYTNPVTSYLRILIRFSLADLPDWSIINSATLTLNNAAGGAFTTPKTWTAYRLTRTNWGHLTATWNTYDGATAWTTVGGDYATTNSDTCILAATGDDLIFDGLKAMLEDAIEAGETSLDLIIIGTEAAGSSQYVNMESGHHADSVVRPKLVISYDQSVYNDCLNAAAETIEALSLPALSSGSPVVDIRKIQADLNIGATRDIALPAIILSPFREMPTHDRGVCGKNDIWYGIACVIMAPDNKEATVKRDLDRILAWRQIIFRAFNAKRLTGASTVLQGFVDPASVTLPAAYKDNLFVSAMLLRFHSRESYDN